MPKTSNLYARIDPTVKAEAEGILAELGLSASAAINMYYKQIIFHRGLPFETKLPAPQLPSFSTREEFEEMLEEGHQAALAGKVRPAKDFFAELGKMYSL